MHTVLDAGLALAEEQPIYHLTASLSVSEYALTAEHFVWVVTDVLLASSRSARYRYTSLGVGNYANPPMSTGPAHESRALLSLPV